MFTIVQLVAPWRGGTFIADIAKASEAKTIRAVDEAVTAPCFGFPSVDAYYEDASADQRVKDVAVPLLILNAADDPIAQYTHKPGVFDLETLSANPNLVIGVTAKGGHLGWCDATDPRGPPGWAQTVALDFLDVACKTIEAGTKPFVENPFYNKPGFGGDDALRCICQNPDEPLYPEGHNDDL